MSVPIDREQWSESSKRSYAYHYKSTTYEDISYNCRKCSEPAVFTAAEQKEAFEVKKAYVWQRRVLCGKCSGELFKFKIRERQLQERWSKERATLSSDSVFLSEWLEVLMAIPTYGQRPRSAMQRRLLQLLESHA